MFQNIILLFTFIAATVVGIQQNRINRNIAEANTRPVISRDGFIRDWADVNGGKVNGNPFLFKIQRNLAQNITGHIIINGKEHPFSFGVGVQQNGSRVSCASADFPKMGYIEENGFLCAEYDPTNFVASILPNEIYLEYQDINGARYFSKESVDFSRTSGKL